MRPALALAGLTALVLASAPSAEGAGADRPRVALSVSPAQLALTAPASRTIKLRNDGAERVVVTATQRTLGPQAVAKWLEIVPARRLLSSGESATLTLRVEPPRRTEPGDHHVLVLLTTRPLRGGRVNVQVRLGVRVRMVVRGRIARRLTLGGLRVHRRRDVRFMFVSVANRGNVTVQLRDRVTASLVRRGRQLARLSPRAQRALRPGARTRLALRYSGRLRGALIAVVQIRLGSGIRVERRYRIRL
ncbi:MAG: hypothetical protein M3R37_08000 [Actinomycetota bacterium]|nr:hypothetical protein [Actinomycetota bacterium]